MPAAASRSRPCCASSSTSTGATWTTSSCLLRSARQGRADGLRDELDVVDAGAARPVAEPDRAVRVAGGEALDDLAGADDRDRHPRAARRAAADAERLGEGRATEREARY